MMRALMNVWEPNAISADFLTMQDAELQLQTEDKGIVTIDDVAEANFSLFTSSLARRHYSTESGCHCQRCQCPRLRLLGTLA